MTTSGTTTFDATRDQIITSALRKVGALGENEDPNTYKLTNGAFVLNTIIKEAHADGMPLWAIKETTIPFSSFTNAAIEIGVGMSLNIPAPLKVIGAFRRDNKNSQTPNDIPMVLLTREEYNTLSSKFTLSTPVQFYYEPQNQKGTLFVWPNPDDYNAQNSEIHIVYQRPFEDAGLGTNTLDFPQEWSNALIYALAWRLCPEYGVPTQDRVTLAKEADVFWTRALSFGVEEGSFKMAPDWTHRSK